VERLNGGGDVWSIQRFHMLADFANPKRRQASTPVAALPEGWTYIKECAIQTVLCLEVDNHEQKKRTDESRATDVVLKKNLLKLHSMHNINHSKKPISLLAFSWRLLFALYKYILVSSSGLLSWLRHWVSRLSGYQGGI